MKPSKRIISYATGTLVVARPAMKSLPAIAVTGRAPMGAPTTEWLGGAELRAEHL